MDFSSLNDIFNLSEKKIVNCVEAHDFEQAIKWMTVRSNLLYESNILFVDDIIENNLNTVFSKPLINATNDIDGEKSNYRLAFVDVVSKDRRGLSNQYVDALIENGVEFLYVTENPFFEHTEIYQHIKEYKRAAWRIVPAFRNSIDKANYIYKAIMEFAPDKVLCHLLPWSIPTVVALSALPKQIIKININITDHAYWAGASIMDYNIEFRNFGKKLSIHQRGFQDTQEFVLPYYPYIDASSFEGFAGIDTKDKVILCWGGALYKIYGEDDFFLKLIAKILKKHPNCICICAGGGEAKHLLSFIKKEGLEKVWHYLGFRKDIFQIVCRCDIFINTYPIGGGLMCQYAAICSKPVIAFAKSRVIEEVLSTTEDVTFMKEEDLLNYVDILINNKHLREEFGRRLNENLPTPSHFNNEFKGIVESCSIPNSLTYTLRKSSPNVIEKKHSYSCESVLLKSLGLKSALYYHKIIPWTIKQIIRGIRST